MYIYIYIYIYSVAFTPALRRWLSLRRFACHSQRPHQCREQLRKPPLEKQTASNLIPYPRANEPVAIPPRRTGGSFVRALINRRNNFRITHAWTLRLYERHMTNQSTPGILTNPFCYHKFNERAILFVFLIIRQFCHSLYTNTIFLLSSFSMIPISLLHL